MGCSWRQPRPVCIACSFDLGSFVAALLAECRQQHDPTVLREPVGDAPCRRTQGKAQLEQPLPQTPGERHPRPRAKVSQPVDQHHHSVMFLLAERGQPLDDLVEQLDFSHPAIIAYLRSSYKCDHGKIASAQNHRRGSGNGPRALEFQCPATCSGICWTHRSFTFGSIFFGMTCILSTQKNAASNLGRFTSPSN